MKDQLLKVEDSLNSALQVNMRLACNNKNLEDRVLALLNNVIGLEMCTLNVVALARSQDNEIARLRSVVADANKETKDANVKKEGIQQKAFDDVYNAHETGFNHCLWQVLHMCDVSDPSVFDINKDVHERELMLIDDISEDDAAVNVCIS